MSKTRNVRDLMNPDIMTVADDMTTDELARYLIEREISGAPVVDSQGHLIGVVSMTDIGRNMAEPSDDESSRSSGFYRDIAADLTLEDLGQRYVEERAVTVRDVMTPVIHQGAGYGLRGGSGTDHGRSAHSPVGRDTREGAGGHHHEHGLVEGGRWAVTKSALASILFVGGCTQLTRRLPRLRDDTKARISTDSIIASSPTWTSFSNPKVTSMDAPRAHVRVLVAAALVVLVAPAATTAQPVFSVLHSFSGASDGSRSRRGPDPGDRRELLRDDEHRRRVQRRHGLQDDPAGTVTVLHAFTGGLDGCGFPGSPDPSDRRKLLRDTTDGGSSSSLCANGYGTVFRMTPDGTVTMLHAFAGGTAAAFPRPPSSRRPTGHFYGTTK